jgi:DNA polymerase-3 subunit alpha
LSFEKETLGLYWSGHPVDRYAAALREFGAKTVGDLADAQPAAETDSWGAGGRKPIEADTAIGGIVAACRQLKTRKGDRMAVFTLEDHVGGVEIVVFPEAYQRAASLIETGTLVLVRGKLEKDDETVRVLASEIAPLDSVRERIAREVAIHLKKPADRGTLETLGEIFSRHRGDRKISFEVETGEAPNRLRVKVDVSSQIRVRPSPALISDIEQVVGAGAVELR